MKNATTLLLVKFLAAVKGYASVAAEQTIENGGDPNPLMPELINNFLEVNDNEPYENDIDGVILILFLGGFNPNLEADGEIGDELKKAINAYLQSIDQPLLEQEMATEEITEEDFKTAGS